MVGWSPGCGDEDGVDGVEDGVEVEVEVEVGVGA